MTVTAVLIRHGIQEHTSGTSDFLAPLSEFGKKIQLKMCEQLDKIGIKPKVIYHSPYLRTTETASIIGSYFHTPIIREDALGIDAPDVKRIFDYLHDDIHHQPIFFISHAPTLYTLSNYLCNSLPFHHLQATSSALILTFDDVIEPGKAHYMHYITPDIIV